MDLINVEENINFVLPIKYDINIEIIDSKAILDYKEWFSPEITKIVIENSLGLFKDCYEKYGSNIDIEVSVLSDNGVNLIAKGDIAVIFDGVIAELFSRSSMIHKTVFEVLFLDRVKSIVLGEKNVR